MQVDLAVLADAATIDGSGKLNILGVFDRLAAAEFPVRHGRIALVMRFSGGMNEAGRHALAIALRDEGGEAIFDVDGELQLTPRTPALGDAIQVPQIVNLDGIVFRSPGRYTFDVELNGAHQASVPLNVVRIARGAEA